ncbi:MAG: MFS transporter [Planctomycetes bacterium]|nr:MFS transporter [Planctomycetota bacterium]
MNSRESNPKKFTPTEWLILFVAALGFAFDIYELLMMPIIGGDALSELLNVPRGSPESRKWIGTIFWSSALSGGFFGLLGGYLTDRFGRRRVLVWSIVLYSFSALAAGFSTSAAMLLLFRCTTFIGVCVEFVAAVAWIAELFRDPRRRERVLGWTQAFSSIGGLMVTGANILAVAYAQHLPAIYGQHSSWRYTLISGLIPAIPLILIRPFLPESPIWREKRERGALKRPSFLELFQPALRRTTITTTAIFACSYGAAFGAIQLTPQYIVPGLPEVKKLAGENPVLARQVGNRVQLYQELGGLTGRVLLAWLAVRIASRRGLLRLFQIPGLLIIPLVFLFPARDNLELLKWGMFAAGLLTVGQFSFWGNYLPRVYPTHLRGTGESFAANLGGRMIGTSAAFVNTQLASFMPGESDFAKVALAAAAIAFFVYAAGTVLSFWLPEPEKGELPD